MPPICPSPSQAILAATHIKKVLKIYSTMETTWDISTFTIPCLFN